MKRSGNLFERIVSVNNIMLAHKNAKKGKRHYREVKCFELRPYHNARKIRNMLIANTYVPSPYIPMTIKDRGKEREILKTRYFPDRIVHHALNFLRTIITTTLKHNIRLISKAIKIKNPLRGFYMVQKIIRNRIQLRLF